MVRGTKTKHNKARHSIYKSCYPQPYPAQQASYARPRPLAEILSFVEHQTRMVLQKFQLWQVFRSTGIAMLMPIHAKPLSPAKSSGLVTLEMIFFARDYLQDITIIF